MGILHSKLVNRNASDSRPNVSDLGAAVQKICDDVRSNGAEKLKQHVADPQQLDRVGRILTSIGKLAVESAVNESLKGVRGGVAVYKIVKEGFYDQPSENAEGSKKPDVKVSVEEMRAKMEKMEVKMDEMQGEMKEMQKDMNTTKQQNDLSTQCAAQGSTQPIQESVPSKSDVKKMIHCKL